MNEASMDPYRDGGLYDKWQEYVQDRYESFQQIVPDTQEGFDSNSDFHAVYHQPELPFETNQPELPFEVAYEGLGRAITPYRWSSYLQDAVVQYCSTIEYTVGRSERCDIVQDIVSDRMERAATMEERYALEDALQIWFRTYGSNGL